MKQLFIVLTFLLISCQGGGYSSFPFSPQNCTVTKDEVTATITCPDGTSTTVIDGTNGPQGLMGSTGVAGAPGSIAFIVKFCPNATAVYPTGFPEVGICMNDKMYAVLWMNNKAALVELPLGSYNTTTTGLNCSFTLGVNCGISN